MGFKITRPEVLNNLVRFKDNLSELRERKEHEQEEEHEDEKKRKYKLLLNRKTGDMRFAQKITLLEHRLHERESKEESLEDFKEVQIIVTENGKKSAQFEVRDSEDQSLGTDIDPLAIRVASETIDLLNKKIKEVKPTPYAFLPEEEVLRDLSSIEIVSELDQIEDLPGWMGKMGRIEAEKKLENQPVGTYLLREGDKVILGTSFHLHEENHLSIHPYIITVVESAQKISDILILETDKGWCQYIDDPNLNDPELFHYFSTAKELMDHLSSIAMHPL